jgi:hypothetical protein
MDDGASVAHHEEPLGLGEDLGHVGSLLEGEGVLVAQHLRGRAVPHNGLCTTTTRAILFSVLLRCVYNTHVYSTVSTTVLYSL